ncbi:Ig-like domain repeat protein [Methanobrevibacter sp. YE315]|uniref:Ig-like domain repeat protein n=1 Tax=Methanobrevibacter sp. YE315 TaxID=1609968 RepID=UPI00082D903B|nr:Ig-like domain repeat protein [Methanobrevibacter sp. YE315]
MDVNKTINKKKLFISILIVLSVFICLTSVAAQDTLDANLTQDYSDEVSQASGDYQSEPLEAEIEESAFDSTSKGNGSAINSASDEKNVSQDKLGATNGKEPLGDIIPVSDYRFSVIQDAIYQAHSGDTIYLKPGTYYNDWNREIKIDKTDITIIGNSAILDAQGQSRIFLIQNSDNVTIQNIKFKNGHESHDGGAIYWHGDNGQVSDCSFENNTAYDSGAIYWNGDNGQVSDCSFVNNTAHTRDGAAIYWDGTNGQVSGCSFVNNTASNGNTIRWNMVSNGKISNSIFVNNNASDSIIYFFDWTGSNLTINNNIFLNNSCASEISFYRMDDASNIDFNWFGNNATDYAAQPNTVNIVPNNWLYMNDTASHGGIAGIDPSDITFDLFVYNNTAGITEGKYANTSLLMPVKLTVTATNGNVNKNVTTFGETITYIPTGHGKSSVTAQIANAKQTFEIPLGDFGLLQDLIDNAGANSVINLTRNYTYNDLDNMDDGVLINNSNVTINGNGYTIDAKGKSRIFALFQSTNITIRNITFKNGHANGRLVGGGAIYLNDADSCSISGCSFVNNTASYGDGGAIYLNDADNCSISGCSFVSNYAWENVIYFRNVYDGKKITINNNIFLDNDCPSEISSYQTVADSNIDFNWFGNNATDYAAHPKTDTIEPNNWLYLNATASPNELSILDSSNITFDLFVYNNTSQMPEDKYDSSLLLPVNLTVTATKGKVSKNVTTFCETITYTPASSGTGSVTAQIANAKQTVELSLKGDFDLLQELIDNSSANSVINLTRNYTYNDLDTITEGVVIRNRNVTINGNGYAIDAKGQSRIFKIEGSQSVIIKNITFKNGHISNYGGAIYWEGSADGVVSECSFVNNSARYNAGAIYWDNSANANVSNCSFVNNNASNTAALLMTFCNNAHVSGCSFVNNSARYNAGAIGWGASDYGSVSGCIFVDNTASDIGGAICWDTDCSNGQISNNIFVNNNAGHSLIYFYNDGRNYNLTINNNIFLDNDCNSEIYFVKNDDASNIDFNWFGNNATDYAVQPNTVNINPNNWLYLNATANPDVLTSLDPTDITFDLFVYNNNAGTTEGKYTNTSLLMPVNLTVTATNGNVNKNVTQFGETITYAPDKVGTARVTASIENVHQTIEIKVKDNLTLQATCDPICFGDNATIIVTGFANATGEARAYVGDGLYCATIVSGVATFNVPGVIENTTATIKYFGDDNYNNASTEVLIIVGPKDASVSVANDTMELNIGSNDTIIATTTPEGLNVTFASSNESVATVDENGTVVAVSAGTAVITVSVGDDMAYVKNSTTVDVTVTKIPTEINIANETVALKVKGETPAGATLTPADAPVDNLTYASSDESIVKVENGKIIAVAEGNATVTVSFAGDKKYAAAQSKTIAVTVTLNDAKVDVDQSSLDLLVGQNSTIVATTTPDGLNVTYTSSDESIVKVDNGQVTAVGEGNATITISVGGDGVYAENSTSVKVAVSKIPTEITLTNDTLDLKVNEWISDVAKLSPSEAGNLTYVSSDESIVLASEGMIFAQGKGTATVTVSFAGNDKYVAALNKTITVNVSLRDARVSVENDTIDLKVDDRYDLNATAVPRFLNIEYVSSNESVATVTDYGIVTAVGEGTCVITLTVGNNITFAVNSTNVTVKVSKIATEINLTNDTLDLKVNEWVDDVAKLIPAEAGNLTFVSSDESIVLASEGMIFAQGKGTATVTVSFEGNDKYAAALNKTITVNVSLRDARVSVENDTVDLKVDDRYDLNATAVPRFLNIEYVSSDESVATVTDYGIVTAVGEGTCVITLTVGNNITFAVNSTNVTVKVSKIATEINLTNDTLDLKVNEMVSDVANLTPADAGNLTFVSSDENIVKVENGNIIAITEGNATVTVSFAGDEKYAAAQSKTITVTVTLNDAKVVVDNSSLELMVGESSTITATTTPEGLDVTFASSDESIVKVDDGQVTAVGEGNATITVSVGGDGVYAPNSTTVTITVTKIPTEISASAASEMYVADESKVDYSLNPSDAKGNVTFTSNNPDAVTVDSDGVIVACGEGSAVININFSGNEKYAASNTTVTVTVSKAGSKVTIEPIDNANYGEDVTVRYSIENRTGNVGVIVENSDGTPVSEDNIIIADDEVTISGLDAGNYTITIINYADDKTKESDDSAMFTVSKFSPSLSLEVSDITCGEVEVITIKSDVPGTVNVTVNGITETLELNGESKEILFAAFSNVLKSDNRATLSLDNLKAGKYPVTVAYNGDDNYESVTKSDEFTVSSKNATIDVDSSDIKVGEDETITVTLPEDATGTVTVELDGANYTAPVENGKAVFDIPDLSAGDKTAKINYSGDDNYGPSETTISFTVSKVKPDVSAQNVSSDDSGKIVISLPEDATGTVTITVDGENYTAPVENGKAIFDIQRLSPGKHDIKVYYSGDDKYEAMEFELTITVEGNGTDEHNRTIESSNVEKTTATGNPILALLLALLAVGFAPCRKNRK